MFLTIRIMIFLTFISFSMSHSSKAMFVRSNKIRSEFEMLTLKKTKSLFGKNLTAYQFTKKLLPLLLNQRTTIKMNTTLTVPFYKIEPVARTFPFVCNIVKFGTIGRINNRSAKLVKLKIAFDRLCKMLRHPRVLQEIATHNFSLWGHKRFIQGRKLIEMFGIKSFNGDLPINIRTLRRGRI